MQIRLVTAGELDALSVLAQKLWEDNTQEDLCKEFAGYLATGAVFGAWEQEEMVGFAQCSLRRDYVEGCSHSPVGYLEGIFVLEPFRGQGIARRLLAACEDWAKQQSCCEIASDCEWDNTQSLAFHLACGFGEANRIICFQKSCERLNDCKNKEKGTHRGAFLFCCSDLPLDLHLADGEGAFADGEADFQIAKEKAVHPLRVILIGGTWVLLQHTGQRIELVGGDGLL